MRWCTLLVAVMLTFPGVLFAQVSKPPVKMGLWRTTNTTKMSGMQLPPDIAARLKAMGRQMPMGQPHTVVTQSCLTPASWKDMFKHMQQNHDCTYTTLRQTSAGLVVDMVCKSGDGTSKIHVDAAYVNSEKMQGKAHGEMVSQRQAQPVNFDTTFESVYQGSDCKGIAPGKAEVVR